jgi:hypothetical protein
MDYVNSSVIVQHIRFLPIDADMACRPGNIPGAGLTYPYASAMLAKSLL